MTLKRDKLGRFVKGITPWNKGKTRVYSHDVLRKWSEAKKGKRLSPATEFKKGNVPWNNGLKGLKISGSEKGWFKKGRKFSKKTEEKMLRNLRKKVLLKPNLEMGEDLAYIIGILMGDGCVYKIKHSYSVVLDITVKPIALSFLQSLRSIGLNPFIMEKMPTNGIGKLKKYVVIANSKNFGIWYKNLSIQKLKKLLSEERTMIGFIRGFYESEGSVSIAKNKYKTINISMFNTDLELIKPNAKLIMGDK